MREQARAFYHRGLEGVASVPYKAAVKRKSIFKLAAGAFGKRRSAPVSEKAPRVKLRGVTLW